ncbi:ABC transporter permease [Natronospirillum operosum]|nr:ABC transporter permease [Natronospirillum operosum]
MEQSAKLPIPNTLSTPLKSLLVRWETFLLAVFAAVFIAFSVTSPYFLNVWNLSDATFNFTERALIALPMAMLIICREIDLSVASIIALASVAMGYVAQTGADVPLIVLTGITVGLLCGLFNGFVVTTFGIPSIVVTIGTMSLFRGITQGLMGNQVLRDYPFEFAFFGQGYVYWVFSFQFVLFLSCALLFYILLHRTNFGRRTYAIGNNPTAAEFSGIKVRRHKMILFAMVGVMAGVASVLLTSRLGSTRPAIAFGWELSIVTMVVLGGVNILGGSGTIPGVVIAAFLMGVVTFGLGLMNIPGIVMNIIIGLMLITVISIPVIMRRIQQHRSRHL